MKKIYLIIKLNMYLTKDVYEYLTNFADDRTILNMLSVNKKFSDAPFFRNVLNRKYPGLIQYKDASWRRFYVEMSYYIAKLEEMGFPYIPGINPRDFYTRNKNRMVNMLNEALYFSTAAQRKDLIDYFLTKRNYNIGNYNTALTEAAKVDSQELVEFFIQKGANDFDNALLFTAEAGHLDLVRFFIEKGVKISTIGLAIQEAKNHPEIIEYLQTQMK